MSDWLEDAEGRRLCDDMADKLMFWVQGLEPGRKERIKQARSVI
jgi:hypothetical protein